MIAHIISINTVFQEQLPVRCKANRPTFFFNYFPAYTFGQSVMLGINNSCTSMGHTAPNGVILPERCRQHGLGNWDTELEARLLLL